MNRVGCDDGEDARVFFVCGAERAQALRSVVEEVLDLQNESVSTSEAIKGKQDSPSRLSRRCLRKAEAQRRRQA